MNNYSGGPVSHYERPRVRCKKDGCRRKAVFTNGLCGPCGDAASRDPFAVIDSYRGMSDRSDMVEP